MSSIYRCDKCGEVTEHIQWQFCGSVDGDVRVSITIRNRDSRGAGYPDLSSPCFWSTVRKVTDEPMTRAEQPASDTVDGLQTMLVGRYREALRQACALLDKRRHPGFAESCATPGCGCPVCAFVARQDVLRLLAGEPERDKLCAICGAVTGGGVCQEHVR